MMSRRVTNVFNPNRLIKIPGARICIFTIGGDSGLVLNFESSWGSVHCKKRNWLYRNMNTQIPGLLFILERLRSGLTIAINSSYCMEMLPRLGNTQ